MSETNDQMSLLDAIGLSSPKDEKKPAKAPEKAAKKKASPKRQTPAETTSEEPPAIETEEEAEPEAASLESEISAEIDWVPDDDVRSKDVTLDQYICFALYSANHAMNGVYKALLKDVGLTYPQFLAMTVLWETNNVPVGAITAKLQLDTNTLTPLLKRLEAMDLLTRTRNKKDERQVILKLTRKGRALQKKTEHFSHCILSSTGLDLEEVMELQSRIMKLRDKLREAEL